MDTFGARLKSEREDRGLAIQAVAETLGVEQDRLLALERNDFEALPEEAEMMACLHAYAECLEVDAELMIEDYVRERDRCLARLAQALSDRDAEISPASVPSLGDRRQGIPRVPVIVLTNTASQGCVDAAVTAIEALDTITGEIARIRVEVLDG